MQNLQINAQRLWDSLVETAKFGRTAKGGVSRLTLSDEDKKVRDWFKTAAEAIGCTVAVDDVGNMFTRRAGRNNSLAPVCMGSHLDTQPTGGKFDGVLGVLGALEVMRTIHEAGYETNAPLEIVNWTNEEGSRFAAEIERVRSLSGAALRRRWQGEFGRPAPKSLTVDLLRLMIANRIQEEAFGTLDRATLKLLDGLAGRARRRERNLKIGTVLVRDYQGRRYTVTVGPDGIRSRK